MLDGLFQSIAVRLGEAAGRTVGVLDDSGGVIACSDYALVGESRPEAFGSYSGAEEPAVSGEYTYLFVGQNEIIDYVVFAGGSDEESARIVQLAAIAVDGVKKYQDERGDRAGFVKNVVLENVLPGDIYSKARDTRLAADVSRIVLLVRMETAGAAAVFDIVAGLFPDKRKDFVFGISESDIVIVKEVGPEIELRDVEKLAGAIIDVLAGDHYVDCVIGIGRMTETIAEVASSFKEARVALEVGKVFDTDQSVISYDNLGVARLIYQLPTTLCYMFLKEVFKRGSIDQLDHETMFTIQRFFENNLNVSETSRGLFVHRNTLVYRLEKIRKVTGLDLREFEHAVVFKVAMMVKKYLDANPVKY